MKSIMDSIHGLLPKCDGISVVDGNDYLEGYCGVPPVNMREYKLSNGSRFLIRPSGTEPKLKVYIEVVDDCVENATEKSRRITEYVGGLIPRCPRL